MAVITEKFNVPDEIMIGLLSGEMVRRGGVVRYVAGSPQGGRIVTHLEPVYEEAADMAQVAGSKVKQVFHNHKTGIIVAGVVTVLTLVGAGVYFGVKHHRRKALGEESIETIEFKNALLKYFTAMKKGEMSISIIDELVDATEHLENEAGITLSFDQFDELISTVRDYTLKLAKDNDYDIEGKVRQIKGKDNKVICLTDYLSLQRSVFESESSTAV